VLLPVALQLKLHVIQQQHRLVVLPQQYDPQQAPQGPGGSWSSSVANSSADTGGASCVSFSPTGANVARATADGVVEIYTPVGLKGNASRHATVACGAPVTCVAWDLRADKLMLIGCSGGAGVRAWHADTRRIMADVPAEPGFPAGGAQWITRACVDHSTIAGLTEWLMKVG
jgi:WD40 repeat protein